MLLSSVLFFVCSVFKSYTGRLGSLELGISLSPIWSGSGKTSVGLGSDKTVSLEAGLLKRNKMLWAFFGRAAFPLLPPEAQGDFFSPVFTVRA